MASHSPAQPPAPPRVPVAILGALLPLAERSEVLADLAVEFAYRAGTFGKPAANRWYWQQLASSAPSLTRRILVARAGAASSRTPIACDPEVRQWKAGSWMRATPRAGSFVGRSTRCSRCSRWRWALAVPPRCTRSRDRFFSTRCPTGPKKGWPRSGCPSTGASRNSSTCAVGSPDSPRSRRIAETTFCSTAATGRFACCPASSPRSSCSPCSGRSPR